MKQPKILLVDDEEELRLLLVTSLNSRGYEVIEATNGQEGLEKARDEKPDIIVADIMMPRMDGFQMCRLLKFDEELKSIPVILLSARTQSQDVEIGKTVGADSYIFKPVSINDLVDKIKEYLPTV